METKPTGLWKNAVWNIENKLFTALLTLPAATIIIFMCIYYSNISFAGINHVMIPIGAVLLLMANICIFAVFDKLIEKSVEVKKMELLYQKSKSENINPKYINKVNEDNKAFLHDVNKFLCITASLIENGKNLELDNMIKHLGVRIEELKNYSYCADPVLNSILCERKFVAESKGILYKIRLGNNLRTVFCKTFLHKIAKTFCRSLQLHFVGNCKPGWQSWYLQAI